MYHMCAFFNSNQLDQVDKTYNKPIQQYGTSIYRSANNSILINFEKQQIMIIRNYFT